jgi:hypothetical protein
MAASQQNYKEKIDKLNRKIVENDGWGTERASQ